jgi:MFS family permease
MLGTALSQLALGLMSTLVPLLMLQDGASSGVIGLVASGYYVGFLLGAVTTARLVMRFGHIRAYAAMAALAAIAAQMLVFSVHPVVIAVSRTILGYACSGLFLAAESWLNDRADSHTRGRFLGAYMLVNWGASALGPLLLRVTPPTQALFALVGMCLAGAVLPMALTQQANPVISQSRGLGLRTLFGISPVGAACCIAAGLLNSVIQAMMPAFLGPRGFDAQDISTFAAAVTVAGMLSQYPVGRLADRIERRRLTLMVLGSALVSALLMLLVAGNSLTLVLLFGCLMAGSTSPLYGLGAGQMNDRLDRSDYVAAAGGLLFAWSIGATVGPALAGALMEAIGPMGLFVYLCGAMLLVAGFVVLRMFARADVPRGQQSGFTPGGVTPPRLAQPPVKRV